MRLPLRRILEEKQGRRASDDFRSTIIVYEIVNDEVVVLYVWHSARARPWEGE
jgi:hypothetical protein